MAHFKFVICVVTNNRYGKSGENLKWHKWRYFVGKMAKSEGKNGR